MSPMTMTRQVIGSGTSRAVCWLAVGEVVSMREAEGIIDEEERRRADRFTSADARQRFVTAHVVLRRVLGDVIGQDPAAVRTSRMPCPRCGGPHGRPGLDGAAGPQFSLSYSGSVVAVAVSDQPVGIDVERLPDRRTVEAVARLLDPREARELQQLTEPDERRRRFARLWVMKEAYLKATGAGIGDGVAKPYLGTAMLSERVGDCVLAPLDSPPGYAAAVALCVDEAGKE